MKQLAFLEILVISVFCWVTPVRAADPVKVFYAGDAQTIKPSLDLAGAGLITFVQDPSQADVLVLNGTIPDPQSLSDLIKNGTGLVLFMGPNLTAKDVQTLLGIPVVLSLNKDPMSLEVPEYVTDRLTKDILWNGSPQIHARYQVLTPVSALDPLVTGYGNGEWLLWSVPNRNEFIFNGFLNSKDNLQFQDWAYYNYLVYNLVQRAGGRTPLSFADYPGSPLPHQAERNILLAVMGLMLVTSFLAYYFVRRYSLKHPEALDNFVSDRAHFEIREEKSKWENVGFHRPLAGFLVALSIGLILFIPLIIYQNLILPTYILPSAQALGIWGRVTQFFNLAWFFFDMGTGVAFIKFMSEYRVHDPKKGIQYGQLFIWWQALSGAFQVALVVSLASTLGVRSAYALYIWSVIIHTFIQLPGFYQVMRHALTGLQRLDYSRFLEIGLNVLFPMIVQPIFVSLMFAWGKAHPAFGGAMGGLLGMGIAAYAAEVMTFIGGIILYKRVGYNVRILFMAHFDWEVIKNSFKFGVFEMLGSAAWSAGQAAEIWITQARLINYAEIWGNWVLAQNFIFAFNVTQTLNDGVMPAISEAFSNGKKKLSQYYSVMAYKYNGMISAFLGAVLLAIAPNFILGASGVDFKRAALYVIPLAIWGAIQFPSWVGDTVQLGANKPYIKSILIFSEQVIRVVFVFILLKRFQVNALIIAYFIGLLTKGIIAYFVNNKWCFPQRFYFWQSLGAPTLAGVVHFLILRWVTGLIYKGDAITSILIFLIGVLPSFPFYMFLYGLFGGWDSGTLDELKESVNLTGSMRGINRWGFYQPTLLGARLSPLNNHFPITNRADALEEARMLTIEKVKL